MRRTQGKPLKNVVVLAACSLLAFGVNAAAPPLEILAAKLGMQPSGTTSTVVLQLPFSDDGRALLGNIRVQREGNECRRTLDLTWNHPYEYRGVLFTQRSRESVQSGPCAQLKTALVAQVKELTAALKAEINASAPVPAAAAHFSMVAAYSTHRRPSPLMSLLKLRARPLRLHLSTRLVLEPIPHAATRSVRADSQMPVRIAELGSMTWPQFTASR